MSKQNAKQNEHIQVFIRCRPLLKSELSLPVPVEVHSEVNKILVRDIGTDKCTVKSFSFDRVFRPDAKQEDIYAKAVAPIIQEVIMGFNCSIFAYGQTGTGKTFTIEGGRTPHLKDLSEDPLCGIIPRSMKHLFNELTEQNINFEICVSFLELYNEEIFDLLSKTDDSLKLKMFDNAAKKGSVIIQGLEVTPVTSMKEVYEILGKGFRKRRKAATLLNKTSSRSHTVFTVTVNIKECLATFEKMKSGKLNLVDLAGSENIGRSGAVDKRAREAGNINQSLLALGRVITSLCENAVHIPYRESKLTRLLQDSLGGQTKTAIIATISPSVIHINETLNTLEYALRAKNIANRPELNTQVSVTSLTKDYLKEMIRLRKGIYECGIKNDFYMPEEHLAHLESTLESKRKEKFRILTLISSLMDEDKSLDSAITESNNNLTEKRNQLEETKLRCEEYRQMLEKEEEDLKLHEAMFEVMQPLYDHIHEKLHEDIEKKRKVESEVLKVKEKLQLSAKEQQRDLCEKFQNLRENQKQRQKKLYLNAGDLFQNIENMHYNVELLTSECNNYVSLLKNGFESATMLCENEFKNLFGAVNELETIHHSFQEEISLALHEEKSTKLEGMDELCEAYLSSTETSILEPLNNSLKDCESSLLGISSAINDWKNLISSELNTRQNLLKEYLDNQKTALQSMTDSINVLIKKEKENIEAYNSIIVECVNSEANSKTLWNDQFFAVERALSSLDLFCIDHIQNKIDKTTQANTHLMNFSRLGGEIEEKLTSYCESTGKNIEAFQEDIDVYEMNTFSRHWDEMKDRVDVSCTKYKALNSELAKFSSISQDVDGLSNRIEDILKNKLTDTGNSEKSAFSQEMLDIKINGDSYQTFLLENQAEIDALLSKDKSYVEKLTENSRLLSENLNKRVTHYMQFIETELLKSLTEENTEVNGSRTEESSIEDSTFHEENDITITSDHLEEAAPVNGSECPVCANKIVVETLQSGENDSHTPAVVECSKLPLKSPLTVKLQPEASISRSLVSNYPRSPVRRPRCRNTLPQRRNLQFPDVEKLAHELLQSSSDEEL